MARAIPSTPRKVASRAKPRDAVAYHRLPTEQSHPRTHALDRLTIPQLVRLMSRDHTHALRAVERARPQIARAIRLITERLRRGGWLIFIGAGTSGRLGVLEAAECPPTFHTPPSLIRAIIAGGRTAVFHSTEGAEDDRAAGAVAVRRQVRAGDVVVGVTASGVTPFVAAALREAARRGAQTILITCNPTSRIPAHTRITLAVGPEILAGSTRLKAGTATKLTLNMLTLGTMVRLGKTYGNLMVDVRPTSRKLRARALGILQSVTGLSRPAAARRLRLARGRVKLAILTAKRGLTSAEARRRLAVADGSLARALHTRSKVEGRRSKLRRGTQRHTSNFTLQPLN